jgi:hypothetical protein
MKRLYPLVLIVSITCLISVIGTVSVQAQLNRSIDGIGNNLSNPYWGAAGTNQLQVTPIGFSDGISEPAGTNRMNPRMISNMVFNQDELIPDATELSDYAWVWGQFIDHDITASPEDHEESLDIRVPQWDNYFDPEGTGTVFIHMKRSAYDPNTGTGVSNPRAFPNVITAYIDASAVYGSDIARANWLRTFENGKLKTSEENRLPYNTITGEYDDPVDPSAPFMAMANPYHTNWFVAGDFRANENIMLTSMHTLFLREHNRLCEELAAGNPDWNDEEIYQKARKIVGAMIQAIVYEEWLPSLGVKLESYSGYDNTVNAGIMNIFSSAAYRYGHTVINSRIVRMENSGKIIPQGNITLKEAFFNPPVFVEGGGVDPLLKGMGTQIEQEFDTKMIHDLRNFLFGPPGAGGLDLASLNINRGRERGLTDYNTARISFGLPSIDYWQNLTSNDELNELFKNIYGELNNIDPWVGFLAEDHMSNTLFGETVMTIMEEQFGNLRDGDRYYYEIDEGLTPDEITEIKSTRLVDIINRNTGVEFMQDNVFIAQIATSVSDLVVQPLEMSVYPNPASGNFFINVSDVKQGQAKIHVADLFGRVLVQKKVMLTEGITNFELNLSQRIPSGIYSLTIVANNRTGTTKIVMR